MKDGLYGLLAARANLRCECCGERLGEGFSAPTVDHFFGRARGEEVEFRCWVLRADHHAAKTDNRPSAVEWCRRFVAHCRKYAHGENGYVMAIAEAEKKAAWLAARKGAL